MKRKIAICSSIALLLLVATATINNGGGGTASSMGFDGLTGATNTTAAMVIGTGASLTVSGSGTNNATSLGGTAAASYALLNSPSFTTPTLGAATATTINKVTLTQPATGSTLTIADGKTLTASNSLTFTGTDGNSWGFPSGNGTVVGTSNAQNLTNKTITSPTLATLVTNTSMGSTTSDMSNQSSATCTNVTGMTWAIAASKNYRLRCEIIRTLAASATMQYCLGGPGTPTSHSIVVKGFNGASSAFSEIDLLDSASYGTKTTASSANANTATDTIYAFIQNGSTASGTNLTLQTAANGTNNITVKKNSWCDLVQVN